jgi:membrane fusion protein
MLFRQEVAAAQAAQYLGSVRLQRPWSYAAVTSVALALALMLVAFATWGEVNRKARLSGVVVPSQGSLNISAPQAGVVMDLPVREGQSVKAGQVLLVLQTERQSMLGGSVSDTTERAAQQIATRLQTLSTERTLRELQTRQREQVLDDRLRTTAQQLRQAEEESALQARRVQLAQTTLARNQQLAESGFVAEAQVQVRQEELIDAKARAQALERARLAMLQDQQTLRGERIALKAQLQSDTNQIDRNRASLDQEASENAARKTMVISAPYAGTITALNLKAGQSVQSGQALATLVPQSDDSDANGPGPLQAQLFAPSRTAGFVRPGQTVYLRYDAYPYQKFGLHQGRITSVSATPFAPSELPPNLAEQLLTQAGSKEALYRVNVSLEAQSIQAYGEALPLKAGLTVEADVLQERRKVWEWVLEPVLAARQRLKLLQADPVGGREGG